MRRPSALLDAERLELDPVGPRIGEQPAALAEQHGHEVEPHLVDELGGERLPRDIRTAEDADGCRARGLARTRDRFGDAAGDELEPRAVSLDRLVGSTS